MNNQASAGAVTTTVSALSDDRLLERTKELSRIDHLREIQKRRLGQLMGRLVREGLDRHDPARPPRGRRAAPAKGAEHTSAPKTQAASARGAASAAKQEGSADSAAPSAAKASAQAAAQPGDEAADRPDTSAAKPAPVDR